MKDEIEEVDNRHKLIKKWEELSDDTRLIIKRTVVLTIPFLILWISSFFFSFLTPTHWTIFPGFITIAATNLLSIVLTWQWCLNNWNHNSRSRHDRW